MAIPPAETELSKVTDEANKSHLSDSEREGNPEESLLTPDTQVDSAVSSKTLETVQMYSNSEGNTGAPALRRSRKKVKKILSTLPIEEETKAKAEEPG